MSPAISPRSAAPRRIPKMQPRGLCASLVMAGYDEGGYCLSLFLCFFFSSSCDRRRRSHRRRHRSLHSLRRLSSPRAPAFQARRARPPQARAVCGSLPRHRRSHAATATPDRPKEAGRAVLVRHADLVLLAPRAFPAVRARRVCLARRACPVAPVCRARRRARAARDAPVDPDVPARLACQEVPVVLAGWSNRLPPQHCRYSKPFLARRPSMAAIALAACNQLINIIRDWRRSRLIRLPRNP